ncbi:mitochondrial ribonuclease P catalytic subunit [Bufo gargarizans]|uniref:mitochondrial ribonuclease P catalytic subunit n=1 Tax=Bufo gargarizans TaxID=30331 RepID=UPI001CF13215|nr:mitochondrial ribonuclease P catalytic subunit [Bufo gargarizans]XP_044127800.1 mitochondrial ribonuclease P catalytic subunit [Bufo gargarizans]XP_044127801.1 mitochondrial ribonuclease P catalytic subunit [Bufo gargarizans]XP_044127802.1 mitochondrial ribonuclease P catalytic subunit [Bufo gargarizans]XP_044127803.1 mitochondrial ribonuclease P catalytic subunit [Bufo gargarizans]
MLSLQLCSRSWCRAIGANRVPVCLTTAGFMPYISRVPVYNPVQTISATCSVNAARVDRDGSSVKYPRQSERKEYLRGSSVFSAGAAKTRSDKNRDLTAGGKGLSARVNDGKVALPPGPLTADGWKNLKLDHKEDSNFEDHAMAQMIKTNADIDIAKSLLSYVAGKDGDVTYKLLLKYLVLCVQQKQIKEIYDMCDIMKMKFQTLETGVHSLLIKGLCNTDRWREAIDSLETLKKAGTPSARNYGECIKGAIDHRDDELAWTLYDEMLQRDLVPPEESIQSLFNADQDLQDQDFRDRLIGVLRYFRESQIYPGQPLMKTIKSWFERIPNETWKGQLTKVTDSGHCQACKEPLESIHLTPEEYSTLKKVVIDSVIKGEDTFRKTTPEELQTFLKFVDSQPPYDIVVDGLNVAYLSRTNPLSTPLLTVVSCLAARGKRILVLGRKHMLVNSKKWLKEDIRRLEECADCFFLDNISLDDPFLLYACLSSGSHCCFITSDLLRDHKACLPNTETQRLFFKWQRGHQLVLPFYSSGNVHLRPILTYDTILQNTDVSWHIPYDEAGVKRASYEVPKTWLCLRKLA